MPKTAVKDKSELPLLMTMKQVQEVTGLAKDLVYRLPHTKGFPVLRFGRVFRVPRDRFLAWLDEQANGQEK